MINRVIIMGRLCADPDMKQTMSGISVCRIRVAVNRPYKKDAEKQESDFINVTCWRQTAEFVARYFSKGKMIIVEGSLRNNDYTDNNGVKHYSMEVLADNVSFGESKNSNGDSAPQQQAQAAPASHPRYDTLSQQDMYRRPAPAPAAQPIPQADYTQPVLQFEKILSDGEVSF